MKKNAILILSIIEVKNMPIRVNSEVGTLRKVVLHKPGKELLHLVPESLSRLLFDDIPFLDIAQKEHDFFAEKLRENGSEVLYLEDLVAEVLNLDSDIRNKFIEDFIAESGEIALAYHDELREYLSSITSNHDLVLSTMTGVTLQELHTKSKSKLAELISQNLSFVLDPIPNLYFTRDTFSSIGTGISLNKMYSTTRARENIYGRYIFSHHPEYKNVPRYFNADGPYSIEGGDILLLNGKTILVGISQRTTPEAIEELAKRLFSSDTSTIENVVAIEIPRSRAFMHLDTVFTQIDYDKFTVHPGIISTLRAFELKNVNGDLQVTELNLKLKHLLAKYLNIAEVQIIYCGGGDSIAAQREQWNDGSNTLCIAPGKVIVYDRNTVTNKLLEDNGIECIKIHSSEISRGRGGPRCMSMPFLRDEI